MNQQDEVDIVEYIKVVYKRRKMITMFVFLGMLLAGTFSLLKPKMYEASATFFPMNIKEYYSSQAKVYSMQRQLDIEDLIISILSSRKMADRIIEQVDLKKIWAKSLAIDARRMLNNASNINLEKNGIIRLSVHTESPELSAKIANAYVDNLDYFNKELDLGAQRSIVQVIDRAIIPDERMARGTVKNTLLVGLVSFTLAIFLAFLLEFIQKSDIKKRLKEE